MFIRLKLTVILFAGLILLMTACNSVSSKKEKTTDSTAMVDSPPAKPPVYLPPGVEMYPRPIKCYANDGLTYKTVVTIDLSGKEVSGTVRTEELESGKKDTASFGGTFFTGHDLNVKFTGTPPVICAASEWTSKPWRIEEPEGKDQVLHIVFKARNYDTGQWEDTDYSFVLVPCDK